jgi:histidinol dehydrogenase
MGIKIIDAGEFDEYWNNLPLAEDDEKTDAAVREIIAAVRSEGDRALRRFAARFDKSSPEKLEVPRTAALAAWKNLENSEPLLAASLVLAADHIRRFGELQKAAFKDFEIPLSPGLFASQRIVPVNRAAIYAPGGRFPLISSVLMGVIPALVAGVPEVILVSPPQEDGLPDQRILAAASLAGASRIFALGGAQAIAALALGTETVPPVDMIAGPGNKYVAAAKRLLFGKVGIDFVAGPTDVLIIAGENGPAGGSSAEEKAAALIAADMAAQAEHDPDARARALVPSRALAEQIAAALEKCLSRLPSDKTARASLEAGGLIIVYRAREEALEIANRIAPEHLELHLEFPDAWVPFLKNYGSLFQGPLAAEVLGDYSAGINHTLPTSGSARFTGGLSVRHFLKTLTGLRCVPGPGSAEALQAAQTIALAEGLAGHAASAASRKIFFAPPPPGGPVD